MEQLLILLVIPIAVAVLTQVYKKIIGYKFSVWVIHLFAFVLSLILTALYFKLQDEIWSSSSKLVGQSLANGIIVFAETIAIYEVILKRLGFDSVREINDKKLNEIKLNELVAEAEEKKTSEEIEK